MHMHQVDPSSKLIGSNFDLGSQGSKGFFFTKNAVTSSIRLTLPVPLAKGAVSSFFFLSFWQHVFFTYFPTSDFDQTWSQWPVCWPLLRQKQWWGQRSGWGHWGQKGHFHQKGIKSFKILSIDAWLMHMHKLDLLYKSYGPKNSSGVIWGHGVKRSFSPKRHQVLQNT